MKSSKGGNRRHKIPRNYLLGVSRSSIRPVTAVKVPFPPSFPPRNPRGSLKRSLGRRVQAVAKALVVVDSLCNRVPGGACSGRGRLGSQEDRFEIPASSSGYQHFPTNSSPPSPFDRGKPLKTWREREREGRGTPSGSSG